MKNLLFFLLLLAAAGLFFHDRQQTADLTRAQDENTQLTQQVAEKQAALNGLQIKVQQLTQQLAQVSQTAPVNHFSSQPGTVQQGAGGLNMNDAGGNPLDLPPQRSGAGH